MADGTIVSPAQSVDLPTALRIDLHPGSVWFVAANTQFPAVEEVFIHGDEILVVFSDVKMRSLGYTDPVFVP